MWDIGIVNAAVDRPAWKSITNGTSQRREWTWIVWVQEYHILAKPARLRKSSGKSADSSEQCLQGANVVCIQIGFEWIVNGYMSRDTCSRGVVIRTPVLFDHRISFRRKH